MPNVIDRYEARLAERGDTADSAQRAAIERLQKLADELADFDNRPRAASGCMAAWDAARAS